MNVYLFDQYGAGTSYSGPGNYFVNLINANSMKDISFNLVHGNAAQENIKSFDSLNFIHKCDNRLNNAVYSYRVAEFVKSNDIDIIQTTHSYLGSISAARAGIKKGVPTFLRIAKSNSELLNRNWVAKTLRLSQRKVEVIKNSQGVVAISKEIENELLSLGVPEEKIKYIPNGVDVSRFNVENFNRNFKSPFPHDAVIIAFCGALIPRKRPHLILETLKNLPDYFVACFIGPYDDNSYFRTMKEFILNNNLTDRVHFTGYVRNPEDYLKCSKYFCLPSENEGMPNALLEAMASQCVAISTNISGVTDIIKSSDVGFIVAPNVDEICSVIRNSEVKKVDIARNASLHISENFSAKSAFNKYIEMYREVL
ncbi:MULTISPECIES: glycosyltransferase family 4 protein [Vibrio]|uniref:glycosyltransferase family 4 protein n=1 Tax=Vibrio TaxID=662 RepID=UPI001A8F6A2E|nr:MULTISPECIES: glycosyltransferase family 4 protein [Vibrio]MBO0147865.1 glycosyltransferase family 4 protein [Vibrio sp. Vb2424]MCS0038173.1 glycosyltransferase family 4 protein [Vibrio alginolyticus]MDW2369287.1 glycosyltransferase family 4 protein [Vibrio sp. 1078-1]